jgi:hypothetical protein
MSAGADLLAIREAFRVALAPLEASGVQVSGYLIGTPTPPTVQVLPRTKEYDKAFKNGVDRRTFIVQGFVPVNEDVETQKLLDELMAPLGSKSIKALLEADKTLGGVIGGLQVTSDSGYSMQQHPAGFSTLLCEWTVEVWNQN